MNGREEVGVGSDGPQPEEDRLGDEMSLLGAAFVRDGAGATLEDVG